jgi:hypothetical protein
MNDVCRNTDIRNQILAEDILHFCLLLLMLSIFVLFAVDYILTTITLKSAVHL